MEGGGTPADWGTMPAGLEERGGEVEEGGVMWAWGCCC